MTAPRWADPSVPSDLRAAVAKVLTGGNYRLFFEPITRAKLLATYRELAELADRYAGDEPRWRAEMRTRLTDPTYGPLRLWLLGLTQKTAQNLNLHVQDYPAEFARRMQELDTLSDPALPPRRAALLLWCGAATLTIRGSQKARIGKALERALARAALTILDLREGEQFWLDVGADQEVGRQTDAEVATPRGRVRIEVGLIGEGNPEVIGDKVGRMDRHGVILFDMLPAQSAMWETAAQRGVRLIQLRNNHPVEELREHLVNLGVAARATVITPAEVERATLALPLALFEAQESP